MRKQGLQGVSLGRTTTTIPDPAQQCPQDKVNRKLKANAPNQLRVADFIYVQTAMRTAYAAFVIDVFARKIVGWCVSTLERVRFKLKQ